MAYRASLGGAFGGGVQRQSQGPQIDIASIIDSIVGAKASMAQQAILRARQQREDAAAQHTREYQDAELGLRRDQAKREADKADFDQKARRGELLSKGYNVDTGVYDPNSSLEVQKEAGKRSRLVQEFVKGGLSPEKAAIAADNPTMAPYLMGYHDKKDGESKDGLTPSQKRAQHGLAAVNTQTDNTQQQLNRTPLPKRPLDQDNAPMEDPNPDDPAYRKNPAQFTRDTATVNQFKRDSTAVAGRRQQLTTKLDSLGAVADTLSAQVQGRHLGAPSTARAGAPVNPAQSDYDAAAAAFKAGPATPERQAKYNKALALIAKKHGQVR